MDKALLDTDIFSEILKAVNQHVVAKATSYRNTFGYYTISVITVVEIVKGLHKLRREDLTQQFLARLPSAELLTLDLQSAEKPSSQPFGARETRERRRANKIHWDKDSRPLSSPLRFFTIKPILRLLGSTVVGSRQSEGCCWSRKGYVFYLSLIACRAIWV